MSTRSLLRTDAARGLILALALLVPLSAFAAKKDDLYKQAQAAVNSGKVEEAARLFCEVAKEDAAYKDAKQNCQIYTSEAERERKRNDDRFQEGVKAFQDKRWDDAEQKFKNVRSGPRLDEARQYINSRIPAARAAEAGEANEKVMAQRFDQGVQAYQRNDFGGAKSALGGVSGSKEGEAKNYLNKIREYEQAMNEGERLASAQNYRGALGSYNEAATIKGDGPGDPRSKASQMERQMAAATTTTVPTTTTTTVPTTTTASKPPPPTTGTTTAKPLEAAIKEPSRPQVDVAKLLREAQAAKDKGDISSARGKYLAILSADPNNRQVQAALVSLPKEQGTTAPKATSEADVLLARAIGEFYKGSYEDAEFHIRLYLENNGGKAGLGQFYLGVSRLTRYFLRGAKPDDKRLMDDGVAALKLAKKTSGFKAPGEQYLSPKILKLYQDATP
jgi:outer membrane protein assembly factor BamD (BamD/ComL family)